MLLINIKFNNVRNSIMNFCKLYYILQSQKLYTQILLMEQQQEILLYATYVIETYTILKSTKFQENIILHKLSFYLLYCCFEEI